MQEDEFEKTRMLHVAPPEAEPTASDTAGGPNPNETIIMRPSARAATAAAALAEARSKRQAELAQGDFQYTGQVDFDITVEGLPAVRPPRRARRSVLLWAGALMILLLLAAAIWWGLAHAARAFPLR